MIIGLGLGLQFKSAILNRSFIAQYGQPAMGLSFRDLLGTDPVIALVRRDSDDAELAFKVSEITDGTLLSWVGAGNDGLIRNLYGQGNTLNAEQATATAQPKIVDAGVLVTKNGLPGMKFDGVNDFLNLTSEIALDNYFNTQVVSPTAFNNRVIIGKFIADFIRIDSSTTYRISKGGSFTGSTSAIGDQMLLTQKRNTSDNINFYKNGVESAESFTNTNTLNINRIAQANDIWFFEGIMQEVITYASDKTSEQAAIESNTTAYWMPPSFLLEQGGGFLLQENGSKILL
jgi:hypothetical protein